MNDEVKSLDITEQYHSKIFEGKKYQIPIDYPSMPHIDIPEGIKLSELKDRQGLSKGSFAGMSTAGKTHAKQVLAETSHVSSSYKKPTNSSKEKKGNCTIQMDYGSCTMDGITYDLFDPPGHDDYSHTYFFGGLNADYAILLFVANIPLERQIQAFEQLKVLSANKYLTDILVVINKCDLVKSPIVIDELHQNIKRKMKDVLKHDKFTIIPLSFKNKVNIDSGQSGSVFGHTKK